MVLGDAREYRSEDDTASTRSLSGMGWDFVVMQLFGGHTCFCTQPLYVRKTKIKENKNNNKKPSCSRQVGFWRNHILICHWCLLGYLDMGLQPSRKALRTECPWETGLVSPPDQVPPTFRSKVLFVLLSLWTQGGSRALSLAGCRVTVGGRNLPILLVDCLVICRQPPPCPPRSRPLNRVIRKRRATGGAE